MSSDASRPSLLHTSLCDLFGIRYPVIQAGMAGGPTTPELVAAVSNAGGLGVLGASRMSAEQVRDAIRSIKSLTSKPFGVNLLLAPSTQGNTDVAAVQHFLDGFRRELQLPSGATNINIPPSNTDELLEIVFEEKVPVLSIGLGDPGQLVARAHEAGALVVAMVTTVDEALCVVESGVDAVVAQGSEAGGHRSTFKVGPGGEVPLVGTMALVPQVADAVKVPVVAAGGIMDGRGLVAALALGAAGAQLGTRFLVARESGTMDAYRERLFQATEADTVVTREFTGRPARGVRNRFFESYAGGGPEPLGFPLQNIAAQDIYTAAMKSGAADFFPLWAGQGLRLLKRGQSAADIVNELIEEATGCLSRLRAYTG